MSSGWYNRGKNEIGTGATTWAASNLKIMLVTPSYVPNPDHNVVNDVVANELSGSGYVGGFGGSGRKALTSKTTTENDTDDCVYYDAADLTWTALNAGTIGYCILFRELTNDTLSPLIAWIDVVDLATTGTNVTVVWAALGILKLA